LGFWGFGSQLSNFWELINQAPKKNLHSKEQKKKFKKETKEAILIH
jgi:hypothetical protein